MPRRTGRRCKARSNVDLDLIVELNLCYWQPLIPGTGFASLKELSAAWAQHGPRILEQWIECMPGSRPSACYYLGEITLPTKLNPARASDTVTKWGDKVFHCRWRYFGSRSGSDGHYESGSDWHELRWLHKLGVVSADEYARARPDCDDRYYNPNARPRRYEPLSIDSLAQAIDIE